MAASSTAGLASAYGTIDVNSMVTQLMQVERNPETLLKNRQQQATNKANALDSINADVANVLNQAKTLATASSWAPVKTTSSTTAVSTSSAADAMTGSLTFSVDRLATRHQVFSTSTVSSTAARVTTASRFLLAAGTTPMGFAQLSTTGTSLALGAHTIAVTQASAGAAKTGDTPPAVPVTISGANSSLNVSVNGDTYVLNLADGTYTGPQQLAEAINAAAAALGPGAPPITASVSGGKLVLTTTNEGSAASLQVTGGTALAELGMSADATALTGTDGKVTVDGTETVLTDVRAGGTASLAAPAGSVSATFAGGVRLGSTSVKNVDLGDGSLSAVVNAINGASGTVTAAAVKVGASSYRLQLQSQQYGTDGRLDIDLSTFDGLSGFATLAAGTDAAITVSGDTTFEVTSATNTFSDVLAGVSFTVNNPTSELVTVSSNRDTDAVAARVQSLIDGINMTVADIKVKSGYTAASGSKGALLGDSTVQRLQQQLTSALTDVVNTGTYKTASAVGITLKKDGTLAFDKGAFTTAYAADPAGVQRLFVATGDADPNPGVTQRLSAIATAASDSVTGYITTSAAGYHNTVTDLGKQVDNFEARMVLREAAMRKQWNAINVALQKLGDQSTSLAQQLAGLTTSSNSSNG